eukprot:GHVP01070010.1.p1 GENE.GHVP01070010.1~~GHVP01070010.1.p1  ORF type:complete len:254 (+),score=34.29 GHVP01070010.1:76-837(+)
MFCTSRQYTMSSSESSSDSEFWERGNVSWIKWYCGLEGHEILCKVDEDYIKDSFNLYGLKQRVSLFDQVIELVLSTASVEEDSDFVLLHREATTLYGLIHARYIMSPAGLGMMKSKYNQKAYGTCPRVYCECQSLLPFGDSESLGVSKVKGYCPKCQEIYHLRNAIVDGSCFGPSFPAFFLSSFPIHIPISRPNSYCPKIFGFRVKDRKSIVEKKLEKGEYGFDFTSTKNGDRKNLHQIIARPPTPQWQEPSN